MITVIDSPCGFGKTQYMINMINENPTKNYIYITPYLNEVKRIKDSAKFLNGAMDRFVEPEINSDSSTKMDSLLDHIDNSDDIVSTHALFKSCSKELTDKLKEKHYTLILDEVMNVVEIVQTKRNDLDVILASGIAKIENNELIWVDDKCDSVYNYIKDICYNQHVYVLDGKILIWTFPIEIFKSFDNVYICTYMFDCQMQKYYYDKFNTEYIKKSVVKGNIVKYIKQYNNTDKIHILDNCKLNIVGEGKYALCKSWYRSKNNAKKIKQLKSCVQNFRTNIAPKLSNKKVTANDVIWTTFKEYKQKLSGLGYSNSFISCNQRATNDYINTFIIMYTINIFMNPLIIRYFENNGVQVNQDDYALSELIQFIYRSAIRNGEDIYCYIPSRRMRELLYNYIEDSKTADIVDI